MKRFEALLKDTWWLWLVLSLGGLVMSFFSSVFLLTFPVCIITFIRFAFVQYDEDGNFVSN